MTYSIAACARNEGPFLIEWIAHHLAIGFDKIFVATNDCDDGTDYILDLLAPHWPVHRIENSQPTQGDSFQRSGVKRCLSHPAMGDQEWVLHIDLDEFLNISADDPQIDIFMQGFENAHAVMFGWRTFGSGDRAFWDGGSVLDSFVTCQEEPDNIRQKAMFRASVFGDIAPHCPKAPKLDLEELRVVNTQGTVLDADVCYRKRGTVLRLEPDQHVWTGAYINHYMHKSHDLTDLSRRARGDANGRRDARFKRTVGTKEYELFNRNEVIDTSIQVSRATRTSIYNALLETPGVLAAHYAAHRWFQDQLLAQHIERDNISVSAVAADATTDRTRRELVSS